MFLVARGFLFIALTGLLLLSGSVDKAQAETPSNSCARELAACGTVHKGMFGVEYVTPEDAARCRAAYDACLAGQQNAQPAPRSSTSPNAPGAIGGQQGVLPPPKPAAPSTQQKAVLPPGGPLTVTGNIQIYPGTDFAQNCTIASGKMRCERSWALGISQWHWQLEATISGSTAIGNDETIEDVQTIDGTGRPSCRYRLRWGRQVRYDFEDGGRVRITESQATTSVLSSTCGAPPPQTLPASSGVTTWKAR